MLYIEKEECQRKAYNNNNVICNAHKNPESPCVTVLPKVKVLMF